jgi:hypothetical protein
MNQQIDQSTTLRAAREQVSCTVEDEAVILHVRNGVYFGLNPVGAFVWNHLKQPHRLSELKEKVFAEFEVSDEQCEADLRELLSDLLKSGLIEVVPEAAV